MRIAQVLTASTGGIGRHVASLLPRLATAGHSVTVLCPPSTAEAHRFADLGAEVRTLRRPLGMHAFDVLHAHGYKAAGWATAARTGSRTPLVVTWHNAVLGTGRSARAARVLQRWVARRADLTLGASEDLVAEAVRLGAPAARLGPVAAPHLPAAARSAEEVRAELGVDPDDLMVLTVSRLAPQKNLGMLLDVAAAVRDDRSLCFVIVGEGPEYARLEARVAAQGLPVRLLGARADVADLLAAADLALLTSTWEARALVAQEALLAGVPLVATRVGGIEELVGDAAVLVELNDVATAAAAVRELASDRVLRSILITRGLRRAAGWPDEDAVARQVLEAYEAVLARQRRVK